MIGEICSLGNGKKTEPSPRPPETWAEDTEETVQPLFVQLRETKQRREENRGDR